MGERILGRIGGEPVEKILYHDPAREAIIEMWHEIGFYGKQQRILLENCGVIDPENIVRAFQFYPSEVGRNTDEILRTLQALQAHDSHENIVTPVNWQPGDDFMAPFLTAEDKEEMKKPDSDIYYINWYMIYKKPE